MTCCTSKVKYRNPTFAVVLKSTLKIQVFPPAWLQTFALIFEFSVLKMLRDAFLAAGGAGPSHRHRSEDLQHPREDGAPRETTCRHTHASTCSHREKYLFSCAFLFSFVSVASFPFFFPFVSKWRLNCGCFISLKKENECCTLFSELFIDHCYLSALENFKYSASKPGRLFNYNYCKQQKHECADRLLMFVPCFYPEASTKGASRVFFFNSPVPVFV